MRRIYLDHNATTPLAPEVREAMAQALAESCGNPSSVHAAGRRARAAVEQARHAVATLLGALPEEIVFTSGGTEGDNLAIRGLARAARRRRGLEEESRRVAHVVSSPIEHPAVLGALAELERDGFEVTMLPVGSRGEIAVEALEAALRDETVLVTLQAANHEIGNLYPIAAFAQAAHRRGALFHSDAVQAVGRVPFDVRGLEVDAATVSAHKLYGPAGAGAVYLCRSVDIHPLVAGGHQERERRGGSENLLGIVGFGAAARLAATERETAAARVGRLRDRLEARLLALPGARLHGDPAGRVPGTTNVGFEGAEGQLVLIGLDLDGICVSTGAACTSGTLAQSPVLRAMGLPAERAREAVRVSLGRDTTVEEVEAAAEAIAAVVARVRAAGPERSRRRVAGDLAVRSPPRIAVAMSGGVDSSVAAALLAREGAEVVGVTLRLYDAAGTPASLGGRCCGPRDIEDARAAAAKLGIAHYVLDESEAFGRAVIEDFLEEHRAGRTPNPCVRCNERIKFGPLLRFARAVGAEGLATGHYARLGREPSGEVRLLRATDREKDQAYFLFGVDQRHLAQVRFPLGGLRKPEVRSLARGLGLPNADKPDSQQICFIPGGDRRAFLEAHGATGKAGVIVDESGRVLGEHSGTHNFTVGQRRGVPSGQNQRRFVVRIDAATGTVHADLRVAGARRTMVVHDVRWLAAPPDGCSASCEVQIRHRAPARPARVSRLPTAAASVAVEFDAPLDGIAPGQAAVFFREDAVLGGGWIGS